MSALRAMLTLWRYYRACWHIEKAASLMGKEGAPESIAFCLLDALGKMRAEMIRIHSVAMRTVRGM